MAERLTIQVHIYIDEAGSFVVDEDENVAAEKADEELGEDSDPRLVTLTLELLPPSQSAAPATFSIRLD